METGAHLYTMRIKLNSPFRKLALFAAGAIVLNIFLTVFAFRILPYDQNRRYKLDADYALLTDTLDYLFIGHSHVNRGIERDSFPNSFMFHGPTETAPYFYYRLKHILETPDAAKADYYVLPGELGLGAFNPQPLMFMGDYWKRYVDFSELARHSETPFYYIGIGLRLKVVPYYQFPSALLFLYDLRKERQHYRQYLRDTWADYDQVMKDTILSFILNRHELIEAATSHTGKIYVDKIRELSIANEAKMIFVKFPLHASYVDAVISRGFAAEKDLQVIDSILLASPNIRIIDFQDYYKGNDTMFMDPHHLSKYGKADFTLVLRDTLHAIREKDRALKANGL